MRSGRDGAGPERWALWGSTLSPFALAVEVLLRFAGLPYHWLPAAGSPRRALRFAWRLDEVGLYLAHHNRWVVSARDNDAGARLARELFESLLAALAGLLAVQPFLFGQRFTLADASVYGRLAMNLSDPSANDRILRRAVHAFVSRLARGDFTGHRADGMLRLGDAHAPLLAWIARGFAPLMQQNAAAYERQRARGEDCFNEAAFDARRALYDGELRGQRFRSVAKSFQVRVWRDLVRAWRTLPAGERARVAALLSVELDDGSVG